MSKPNPSEGTSQARALLDGGKPGDGTPYINSAAKQAIRELLQRIETLETALETAVAKAHVAWEIVANRMECDSEIAVPECPRCLMLDVLVDITDGDHTVAALAGEEVKREG